MVVRQDNLEVPVACLPSFRVVIAAGTPSSGSDYDPFGGMREGTSLGTGYFAGAAINSEADGFPNSCAHILPTSNGYNRRDLQLLFHFWRGCTWANYEQL